MHANVMLLSKTRDLQLDKLFSRISTDFYAQFKLMACCGQPINQANMRQTTGFLMHLSIVYMPHYSSLGQWVGKGGEFDLVLNKVRVNLIAFRYRGIRGFDHLTFKW